MRFQPRFLLLAVSGVGLAVAADEIAGRDPQKATQEAYQESITRAAPESRELAELRLQIAEANRRLGEENRQLMTRQAEIERTDVIAKNIRTKLLAAEKRVRELRAELKSHLDSLEEVQELNASRRELLDEVQALRDRERALIRQEKKAATRADED